MPPTNAELTAEVEKLTRQNEELAAKLEASGDVEALQVELAAVKAERDEAREHASGASQNAQAVQEVQHAGAVLNPTGQQSVPEVPSIAPGAMDLVEDSEPCTEHYPKGWPAEEPGAAASCPHGRWIYGQTPKTKTS